MICKRLFILFINILISGYCIGQSKNSYFKNEYTSVQDSLYVNDSMDSRFLNVGDTLFIMFIIGVCKYKYAMAYARVEVMPVKIPIKVPFKEPFLKVHGNIAYTFDYRSRLDTPFTASNLQQHNEQVYADAVLKGRYPFRIIVNSRQSNSRYFKDYTDINIQFDHQAFKQMIKQKMIAGLALKTMLIDSTSKYKAILEGERAGYLNLKNWVKSPARIQEIVQEKEKTYSKYLQLERDGIGKTPAAMGILSRRQNSIKIFPDTLSQNDKAKDSVLALMHQPTETEKKIKTKEKALDSIYQKILAIQHHADSLKANIGSGISEQTNKIKNANSIGDLEEIDKKYRTNTLTKSDKNILSITQLGIGRSAINYSDLTASNISLTGLNIEYNPSYYAAFAIGSVDYLFRNFVVNPGSMPKQNLILGRYGWGDKDKRIFIITAYTGTKNSFGGTVTDTLSLTPMTSSISIFGYSLEEKYKINRNADASVEFAKSSTIYNSTSTKANSVSHAFSFTDRHNEAWSAKLNFSLPAIQSAINMYYKKTGSDFQSYSIYNSGIQQVSWGLKWRQNFFKSSLALTLQLKRNGFDNPLIPITYNSSVIFKSIQIVYRKKKWPVFSVSYMPTTQLIKSSDGYFSQSIFYALTAGVFYNYTLFRLRMNSGFVYNRFFNKGTDSGFIFYDAQNILYSHSMDMGKWHSQSDVQYTKQPGFVYWTFQERFDVQMGKYLTIGIGAKNNIVPLTGQNYWGGSGQIGLRLKGLGMLHAQYDKGYLPNGSNALMRNNWGRIMWSKVF